MPSWASRIKESSFTLTKLILMYLLSCVLGLAFDAGIDFGFSRFVYRKAVGFTRDHAKKRLKIFFGYVENLYESPYWEAYGKQILAASALVSAAIAVFFMTRKKLISVDAQSSVFLQDHPLREVEEKIESTFQPARVIFDGGKYWNNVLKDDPKGKHTGPAADMESKYRTNVRTVISETTKMRTHVLGICEDYALVNTHALGTPPTRLRVFQTADLSLIESVYQVCVITDDDRRDLGNDISVIRLRGQQFRDITGHIPDSPLVHSNYAGWFYGKPVRLNILRGPGINLIQDGVRIPISETVTYHFPDHRPGECGRPIFTDDAAKLLIGFHAGGMGDKGFGVLINRIPIQEAIESIKAKQVLIPVNSQPYEYEEDLEMPVRKSPFRHIEVPGVRYLGKAPGYVEIKNRSRMSRNKLYPSIKDKLESMGINKTVSFGKPLMMPEYRDGVYVSPYNNALLKMSKSRPPLDSKILDVVIDRIVSRAMTRLRPLKPLTMQEAINGCTVDNYIRRINVRTGAGYGFEGKKSKFLPVFSESPNLVRAPDEHTLNRVGQILANYSQGMNSTCFYTACLKDEPREFAKIASGKTRLFYMQPLDQLIVNRMMLAPLYTAMTADPDLFCTAIGIDMMSNGKSIVEKLQSFSDLLMEGDYGNYDLGMPFDIGLAANTIVYRILERCGYSEEALKIVKGILSDNLYIGVTMLKDMILIPGLQPSGKYATAEDNSLRGLILLMYFWYSHEKLRDMDFFEYVLPVIYGDDMLAAIKRCVSKYFNNLTYRAFCEEEYKLEFTPASKSGDMSPFVDIHTASFLKKNFRYRPDIGMWVCPLSSNSIHKALEWNMPSSIPTSEQTKQTLDSMLWELVPHLSEEKHDEFRSFVTELMLSEYEMECKFPTWRFIVNRITGDDASNIICVEENDAEEVILREGLTIQAESYCFSREGDFLDPKPEESVVSPTILQTMVEMNTKYCANETYFYNPESSVPLSDQISFYKDQRDLIISEMERFSPYDKVSLYSLRRRLPTCDKRERDEIKRVQRLRHRLEDINSTINILERLRDSRYEIIMESEKVENFGDLPGASVDEKSAGTSDYTQEGQKNFLLLDDFLSRPVKIYDGQLATGTDLNLQLSIWDLFTLQPSVRSKLRNFAYLKGNMHVRIVVSGSPFHYGRLLVSYQPYASYNENITQHLTALPTAGWRTLFLNYLSQAKGAVTINVNENRPVEVEAPFISPKPMFRLFNNSAAVISAVTSFEDLAEAGDLFIYSINQVGAVSSAPTPIYIQVYAWMDNAELGTNTATQLDIQTESMRDERMTGPVEHLASSAQEISNALVSAPYVGIYAKASSVIFGALRMVASHFGWSKPTMINAPSRVKNEPFQNGANTIGYDTNQRLVLDPRQEVTVDPRVVGISEDDMAICSIASVPSYYNTFTWDDSDAIMQTPLHVAKVTPCLGSTTTALGVNYVQPTALAFSAAPFQFWRGDITFRFEVVCSAFHRGKLAVIYEPNLAQQALIVTNFEYNKQYMRVIDIQETTTFEVTVEWAAPRPWLQVSTASAVGVNQGVLSTTGVSTANGFIAVVPFTKLQSPDGSSVKVNTYVYSKNIRYNVLSPTNMPSRHEVPAPGMMLDIPTEAENMYNNPMSGLSSDVLAFTLNPSTATTEHVSEICFGEQPVSFRALLKRYVTSKTAAYVAAGAANTYYKLQYYTAIMPPNENAFGTLATRNTLFSYLYYAYLAYRGGIKIRIHPTTTTDIKRLSQNRISLRPPSNTTESSVAYYTSVASADLQGTASYVPHTNGGLEAEIPFYSPNLFHLSFTTNPTPTTLSEFEGMYTRSFAYELEIQDPIPAGEFVVDYAIADDFSFMRFTGAQFYSYV